MNQTNKMQPYWYDAWCDDDGNYAYINTNINPEQFSQLEEQFKSIDPKEEEEDWREYENRFFAHLRELKYIVHIINRPIHSLDIRDR